MHSPAVSIESDGAREAGELPPLPEQEGPLRLLLVDDDEDDYLITRDLLNSVYAGRLHLDWVSAYEAALEVISRREHDVYLVDYRLAGQSGLDLLRAAVTAGCREPIILLTGEGSSNLDQEAMRIGAADYLDKNWINGPHLERTIRHAIERKRRTEEVWRRAADAQSLASRLKRRLDQEEAAARALAESFLCPTPRLPGFQVASHYEPASDVARVGGDYFDFIRLHEHRMGIVIGDVCGKGTRAAAYTAMARHMLRAYALEDPAPAHALARLNLALCEQMSHECPFLTLIYGILDLGSFEFVYANGGHPPPLLWDPDDRACRELRVSGGMLGVLREMEFTEDAVTVKPGSVLALFTDGVHEARRGSEMLGMHGVRRVVEAYAGTDAGAIATALLEQAHAFAGERLQDDAAAIVIKNG